MVYSFIIWFNFEVLQQWLKVYISLIENITFIDWKNDFHEKEK